MFFFFIFFFKFVYLIVMLDDIICVDFTTPVVPNDSNT